MNFQKGDHVRLKKDSMFYHYWNYPEQGIDFTVVYHSGLVEVTNNNPKVGPQTYGFLEENLELVRRAGAFGHPNTKIFK